MYDDAAWYLAQLNNLYKIIRMEFEELYKIGKRYFVCVWVM
jgi:hypothetical protein